MKKLTLKKPALKNISKIEIRIDSETKAQAQQLAHLWGTDVSKVVRGFIQQAHSQYIGEEQCK